MYFLSVLIGFVDFIIYLMFYTNTPSIIVSNKYYVQNVKLDIPIDYNTNDFIGVKKTINKLIILFLNIHIYNSNFYILNLI